MNLIRCEKSDYKDYMEFVRGMYRRFSNFKDSTTPVVQEFLYKKGPFCRGLDIIPVMVKNNQDVIASCMYIQSPKYEGVLQIAFFEALADEQKAVDLIMEQAIKLCRERELCKISIGLNGHVNYSIGFLKDHFDGEISFGSSFTPPYYMNYFLKYDPRAYEIVSFNGSMDTLSFEKYDDLLSRTNESFEYRHMDFRRFRDEMKIYTDLNNICFKEHPFYFDRSYEEDHALFNELRYFIKGENIIFVLKDGKPIGYLLWYGDFNELLDYGETIGVPAYLRYKLLRRKIRKLKIVEIAVLPEYQNSGAIMGLFYKCYQENAGSFDAYETSWIFEENFKSRNFGEKLLDKEYKHYVAYEITLPEDL